MSAARRPRTDKKYRKSLRIDMSLIEKVISKKESTLVNIKLHNNV